MNEYKCVCLKDKKKILFWWRPAARSQNGIVGADFWTQNCLRASKISGSDCVITRRTWEQIYRILSTQWNFPWIEVDLNCTPMIELLSSVCQYALTVQLPVSAFLVVGLIHEKLRTRKDTGRDLWLHISSLLGFPTLPPSCSPPDCRLSQCITCWVWVQSHWNCRPWPAAKQHLH